MYGYDPSDVFDSVGHGNGAGDLGNGVYASGDGVNDDGADDEDGDETGDALADEESFFWSVAFEVRSLVWLCVCGLSPARARSDSHSRSRSVLATASAARRPLTAQVPRH